MSHLSAYAIYIQSVSSVGAPKENTVLRYCLAWKSVRAESFRECLVTSKAFLGTTILRYGNQKRVILKFAAVWLVAGKTSLRSQY